MSPTIIEANNMRRLGADDDKRLTDDDKQLIRDTAKKPNIGKIIVNSIAPSTYGH